MDQPTAAPDPGWYPDAADPALERWWDGASWSPVTRPSPEPPAPAADSPGARGDGPSDPGEDGPGAERPGGEGSTGTRRNPYAAPPRDAERPPPGPSRGPDPSGDPDRSQGHPGGPGGPGGSGEGGPHRPGSPGSGYGPVLTTPDGAVLAAAWLRLLARVVDAVILSLLNGVFGAYYLVELARALAPQLRTAKGIAAIDFVTLSTDPVTGPLLLRYGFVGLLVGGVYSVVFLRLLGGTPGKLVFGLRVRSWEEPGNPDWTQALGRWLTREVVSQIPFGAIGSFYLVFDSVWLLRDPRRQCLHDKLPGTVVVQHRQHRH